MVTIRDVANQAGVSISTVSRALSGKVPVSEEKGHKIFAAVNDLDYKPNVIAQGLKKGQSKTIGLIIPNFQSLVFPAAIKGISDVLAEHGYTLILCNTEENIKTEKNHINNLRMRMADGFILSTATKKSDHILKLKEEGTPLVLLLRHMEDKVDAVISDNFQGAYEGTRFLLNRGFREIAFINGPLELDIYKSRYEGFKSALAEGGFSGRRNYIIHDIQGYEDGYQAMLSILKQKIIPDAVFATSDPKAFGTMKALREKGLRIPEDVSVLGFDNLEMASFVTPPLTTVSQQFYKMGAMSAKKLLQLIEKKQFLRPLVEKYPTELIIRESVGNKGCLG